MLKLQKTVNLDSLGEVYQNINLVFNCIPASQLPKIREDQSKLSDELSDQVNFILGMLKDQFVSGKQGDEDISKEDLDGLDEVALLHTFKILAGVEIDPKAEMPSTSSSSTE
jgi:hypothetical protein